MSEFIELLAGLILLIVVAYVVVRVISIAYFRTKFEHLQRTLRAIKNSED